MRKITVVLAFLFALGSGGYTAEVEHPIAEVRPPAIDGLPEVPLNQIRSSYRITVHEKARNPFTGGEIEGIARGTGTGVDERHILTAAHVVTSDGGSTENITAIDVDLFDGDGVYEKSIPAKTVRLDTHQDLALLEVTVDLPFHHALHYGHFVLGRWSYLIGGSWGFTPYSVYWGMLAAKSVEVNALDGKEPNVIVSQVAITSAPGCSGGGLYSPDGHFLGVLVRGTDTCIGLYVPADTVKKFMESENNVKPVEPVKPAAGASDGNDGGNWKRKPSH